MDGTRGFFLYDGVRFTIENYYYAFYFSNQVKKDDVHAGLAVTAMTEPPRGSIPTARGAIFTPKSQRDFVGLLWSGG
jgi:hypothetical protein